MLKKTISREKLNEIRRYNYFFTHILIIVLSGKMRLNIFLKDSTLNIQFSIF